jgi:alkylation response protein AidB-like acyl-CoA dehydrogenase
VPIDLRYGGKGAPFQRLTHFPTQMATQDATIAVLVVDLPDREDDSFQLVRYGLYALRQAHNNGMRFKDFRVPKGNLLKPAVGDGLTIAYHGLNLRRPPLCAGASGTASASRRQRAGAEGKGRPAWPGSATTTSLTPPA